MAATFRGSCGSDFLESHRSPFPGSAQYLIPPQAEEEKVVEATSDLARRIFKRPMVVVSFISRGYFMVISPIYWGLEKNLHFSTGFWVQE